MSLAHKDAGPIRSVQPGGVTLAYVDEGEVKKAVAVEGVTRGTKQVRKRIAAKTKVKADGRGRPTQTPLSRRAS